MTAGSLTWVRGVVRRHRARRNTGGPSPRGVATLLAAVRRTPRWVSEGSTGPCAPTRQQNWWGGKGSRSCQGVCLNEPRGGRLA